MRVITARPPTPTDAGLCCYSLGIRAYPQVRRRSRFPSVTWAGTDAPTNWAGDTGTPVLLRKSIRLLDNLQWVNGKHSLTFGGQIAWLHYNVINVDTGRAPRLSRSPRPSQRRRASHRPVTHSERPVQYRPVVRQLPGRPNRQDQPHAEHRQESGARFRRSLPIFRTTGRSPRS